MCSISVVPDRDGFRMMCNRDERRDRPAALPPAWRRLGRRSAIYPIDPVGPGAWIGANENGLAAALLNRRLGGEAGPAMTAAHSRGLVVLALLDELTVRGAIDAARSIDLSRFALFRVLVVEPGAAALLTSDGRALAIEHLNPTTPIMITSSSLGDELVERPRRQLFEQTIGRSQREWLRGQERFHSHRWPLRPDISVMMDRADARTVSRTSVSVTSSGVRLRYTALVQHEQLVADVA